MFGMMSARQYYGDLYVVHGDALSKYARRKLGGLTRFYGFVFPVEDYGDKVKVEIYYLDFCFAGRARANYISTEMVEKKDIHLLDWNLVLDLYRNHGFDYIVNNYLHHLEIFNTSAIVWGMFKDDERYAIYNWPDCFDESKAIRIYDTWRSLHKDGTEWMIEQVESGKVDIAAKIKELKEKYNLK